MLSVLQFAEGLDEGLNEDFQFNITLDKVIDSLKEDFRLSQDDISSITSESSEYSQAVKVITLF